MAQSRLVRWLFLILLSVGLFGCDHATKLAAKASLEGAPAVQVAPAVLRGAVELRYAANDDIAFSAFHRIGVAPPPVVLAVVAAVAILAIVLLALRARRAGAGAGSAGESSAAAQAGLALIVAGAAGNVVDRIVRGYVVDFIHVKGWPIFNVADIAVVAGVGLMALARWRHRVRPPSAPAEP